MDINSLTANRIKELRLETGKSQDETSKEIGISKSAYERLENGKVNIDLKSLELIANYYSITVPEVITQKSGNSYSCENSQAISIQQGNNTTFNLNMSQEDAEKIVEIFSKAMKGKK